MRLGAVTLPFADQPLEKALDQLTALGVDAVELACGGYPGEYHLERSKYLDNPDAQATLQELLDNRNLSVCALDVHNNPLHPNKEKSTVADRELRETVRLADQLNVDTVACFSGLPAGGPGDDVPNWITSPWPPEHAEALNYQWKITIKYWRELVNIADEHDVGLAIEMHPNMLVYEPHSLMRLRDAVGDRVGATFDPSHLYWQGIDVLRAIRFLGDAIYHVHVKDTQVYESNAATKGMLDTTPYLDEADRSWLFRTVGYGHGEDHWRDVVSVLRMVGFDDVLSIEQEDSITARDEGLEKAVDLLSSVAFNAPGENPWG